MEVEYEICKIPYVSYYKEYDKLSVSITPGFKISKREFSKFMMVVDYVKQSKVEYVYVYYYPEERSIRIYSLYDFDITIDINNMKVKKVKVRFFNIAGLLRKLFMIENEFKLNVTEWIEAILDNVDVFREVNKSYEYLGKYFIDNNDCLVFYDDLIDFVKFSGCKIKWNSLKFRPIVNTDGYIIGFSYLGAKFLFDEIDFNKPLIRGSIDEYVELRDEFKRNIDFIHHDFKSDIKQFIQMVDDLVKAFEGVKKVLITYDGVVVDES